MLPFNQSEITRGPDQIARYDHLATSLVSMLRATVDRYPNNEAIVELGGPRINYRDLWDRSARVAGDSKQSASSATIASPSSSATALIGASPFGAL